MQGALLSPLLALAAPVKTIAAVRAETQASPAAPKAPPGQGAKLNGMRAAARPAG